MQIAVHTTADKTDYISLTDIARYKSDDPTAVIQNWLRNRETIEFLGLWEELNNPDFKHLYFEGFKMEAGRNAFVLSPKKWIEFTGAIGIQSKSGRYGGTFAHVDIVLEFASWISPEFKLYINKDYQRLKVNYRIHTDAIKEHLLPKSLMQQQINFTYASEADMLNVALFGMTAKDWRKQNPDGVGNIRDYATIYQRPTPKCSRIWWRSSTRATWWRPCSG